MKQAEKETMNKYIVPSETTENFTAEDRECFAGIVSRMYADLQSDHSSVLNFTLRDGHLPGGKTASYEQFVQDLLDATKIIALGYQPRLWSLQASTAQGDEVIRPASALSVQLQQSTGVQGASPQSEQIQQICSYVPMRSREEGRHFKALLQVIGNRAIPVGDASVNDSHFEKHGRALLQHRTAPDGTEISLLFVNKGFMGVVLPMASSLDKTFDPQTWPQEERDAAAGAHRYEFDAGMEHAELGPRTNTLNNYRFLEILRSDPSSAQLQDEFLTKIPQKVREILADEAFGRAVWKNDYSTKIISHVKGLLSPEQGIAGVMKAHEIFTRWEQGLPSEYVAAINWLATHAEPSTEHRDEIVVSLKDAPEDTVKILASFADQPEAPGHLSNQPRKLQAMRMIYDRDSQTLMMPCALREIIYGNLEAFMQTVVLEGVQQAEQTRRNPSGIWHVQSSRAEPERKASPTPQVNDATRVQTLAEVFPDEMRIIDAMLKLYDRLEKPSPKNGDYSRPSDGIRSLRIQNAGENASALHLLKNLATAGNTKNGGVYLGQDVPSAQRQINVESSDIVVTDEARWAINEIVAMFREEVGKAKEALEQGDKDKAHELVAGVIGVVDGLETSMRSYAETQASPRTARLA